MPEFEKVVIFGTGLIGGSFALGLKEAGAVEEVVGFGRTPATLRKAVGWCKPWWAGARGVPASRRSACWLR